MRTLMKVTLPVETSNKAVRDGKLSKIVEATIADLKPESAYFYSDAGQRACLMVFDLKDPSQIPVIAEPLFATLDAKVEFLPVMNAEDLKKGLELAMKKL